MGGESFSRYKNVPGACGQSRCLLLPSGALRTSILSQGQWALVLGKGLEASKIRHQTQVQPLSGRVAPGGRPLVSVLCGTQRITGTADAPSPCGSRLA